MPNAAAIEPEVSWLELQFEVPLAAVDSWSDALLEAGALSVDAQDADADSLDEIPLYGEPGLAPAASGWQRTRLTSLWNAATDPAVWVSEIADALALEAPDGYRIRRLVEQDWVRLTQSQFNPIPIGTRLLIAPSWHAHSARGGEFAGRLVIELDPGLAFGTGSHPTTRLCLEWLEAKLNGGETVIDYGCGSGILAIAAARLGARSVFALDIDPQALQSTRANALANPPTDAVICVGGADTPDLQPAQIVIANILSMPLKLLAPVLTSLLEPGGTLVLSGVLERQAAEVASAYAPAIALTVASTCEDWVCLVGRRPHATL